MSVYDAYKELQEDKTPENENKLMSRITTLQAGMINTPANSISAIKEVTEVTPIMKKVSTSLSITNWCISTINLISTYNETVNENLSDEEKFNAFCDYMISCGYLLTNARISLVPGVIIAAAGHLMKAGYDASLNNKFVFGLDRYIYNIIEA